LHRAVATFVLLTAVSLADADSDAPATIGANTAALFASEQEGIRLLTARDDFIERLSPFDRASRLKTDREVLEPELLRFVAKQVRPWREKEKQKIRGVLSSIGTELKTFSVTLPDKLYFIKTTGKEEGNAAYTRGNGIVLPVDKIQASVEELQRIVAHELFHIISRYDARLREDLYRDIGFKKCDEVSLSPRLRRREFTNPDAPRKDHYIEVVNGREAVKVVPVLLAKTDKYDLARGGEFFDQIDLRFLVLDSDREGLSTGRFLTVDQLSGFFDQVGMNTEYVTHPEEILADNFAALVLGDSNVRSPELLARMSNVLRGR
jgi:hypothetical protein